MQNSSSLFRRDPNTILKLFIAINSTYRNVSQIEGWGNGSVVMMFAVEVEDLSLIMGPTW